MLASVRASLARLPSASTTRAGLFQRAMATAAATGAKLERAKAPKALTEYKKPFSPRKQYLFSEYERHFVESPAIIVMQHHNLGGVEQAEQRRDFKLNAQGARMMIVRSKMLKAVLRHTRFANMGNLFSGPTAVVYWRQSDVKEDFDPLMAMKQVMESAGRQRKLILMGAKFDNVLLNPAMMRDFVNLPHIDQLRGQILGVIQSPAQQLSSLLQRIPQRLAGVLKQRADGAESSSEAK
ncbi:hypothetical protein GQ54DRAFT_295307 [Martensiomyces pterosporus]|nr:hypothetical protein GQ54DRAFT_295307 [Martensiomyces pterosporus]